LRCLENLMPGQAEPVTADNAAFLFIDNQTTTLMLGVQSIDMTVLLSNTTALAALAKIYDIPPC
jgi:hypothetical protein